MLKTIAAALLATSLIASPVLAQGNSAQPATTTMHVNGKAAVKHHKAHRHIAKIHKHRKHVKHVGHIKRSHAPKASLYGHKYFAKQGKYLRVN